MVKGSQEHAAAQPDRRGRAAHAMHAMHAAALAVLAALAAAATLPPQAHAQNSAEIYVDPTAVPADAPTFSGDLLLALEHARVHSLSSSNGTPVPEPWNTVDPIVQASLRARITDRLSLSTLAEVRSYGPPQTTRRFSQVDAKLNNLFASYALDQDSTSLFAGKVDIGLGEAWHSVDGIYSGFSGDYEYAGSVGLGVRHTWQAAGIGRQSLTGIVFKRDNSALSGTWFTSQPTVRLQPEDGGPGNTTRPQSLGLSYGIDQMPGAPGLGLSVDAFHLAAGEHDDRGLDGMSATVTYQATLAQDMALILFGEAVYTRGFLGKPLSASYQTLAATLASGNFSWTAAAGWRRLSALEGSLADQGIAASVDHGVSLTGTYRTPIGVLFQTGVERISEQGLQATQTIVRLIYQASF